MALLILAACCVVCGVLGAVSAERNKGGFRPLIVGVGLSAFGVFIASVWTLTLFPLDGLGWMVWFLYIATAIVAAVLHFIGFFLCCAMHAAGNDVSA